MSEWEAEFFEGFRLCVLFRSEDGEAIGASSLRTSKNALASRDTGRVTSVSLAANSLTSMKVFGSGNEVLARHVAKGGRIEVFGYFPNRKEFSQPIDPRRDAWSPIAPLDVRERGMDG